MLENEAKYESKGDNTMSNMSYCRFENTERDLRDCMDHIHDDPEDLSGEEKAARDSLIELCKDIASEFGDVDDYEDHSGDNEHKYCK